MYESWKLDFKLLLTSQSKCFIIIIIIQAHRYMAFKLLYQTWTWNSCKVAV